MVVGQSDGQQFRHLFSATISTESDTSKLQFPRFIFMLLATCCGSAAEKWKMWRRTWFESWVIWKRTWVIFQNFNGLVQQCFMCWWTAQIMVQNVVSHVAEEGMALQPADFRPSATVPRCHHSFNYFCKTFAYSLLGSLEPYLGGKTAGNINTGFGHRPGRRLEEYLVKTKTEAVGIHVWIIGLHYARLLLITELPTISYGSCSAYILDKRVKL